jgi:hypothetical protein
MIRSGLVATAAFLLFGLVPVAAPAQQEATLGVEVVRPDNPHFMAIGSHWTIDPPPRLPGTKFSKNSTALTRITIAPTLEDGGVRIAIGGVFDDSYPADAPGPKYGEKEKPIASYFANEGDTVVVKELEDYGREKLILRVKRGNEWRPEEPVASSFPQLVNTVQSIVLINVQADSRPSEFLLTLQNASSKDVVGLSLKKSSSETETWIPFSNKPLVAAQAMMKTSIRIRGESTISVKSVLFADGSYDGAVVDAAEMAARRLGSRIQRSRLLQLLLDQPRTGEPNEILDQLKQKINDLRIDVDPADIDQIQSQFRALPKENGRPWIAEHIMYGLKMGRSYGAHKVDEIDQKRRNQAQFDWQDALKSLGDKVRDSTGSE